MLYLLIISFLYVRLRIRAWLAVREFQGPRLLLNIYDIFVLYSFPLFIIIWLKVKTARRLFVTNKILKSVAIVATAFVID